MNCPIIMIFIVCKLLLICMSCQQYLVNVNALEVISYCDFVESFKVFLWKNKIMNKTYDSNIRLLFNTFYYSYIIDKVRLLFE